MNEQMRAWINRAEKEHTLTMQQIKTLIEQTDSVVSESLYESARRVRDRSFGNKVFLYGFVYFSTYCKNDCHFCYYRKSNPIERYRKTKEETLAIAKELARSGVHLIDLTMGEDHHFHEKDCCEFLDWIEAIQKETGLPIMVSPGLVSDSVIEAFAKRNVAWYALYQETHNTELFQKTRINQDYAARIHAKKYAKAVGLRIEEGIMTGIGESSADLAHSLLQMGALQADQMRVMSFVPQVGSPMETVSAPARELEYKIIALMRLLYPSALIPASLDIDGITGLSARLRAGANVITSLIPPSSGLCGVAQSTMGIEEGSRTVAGIESILKELGLAAASTEDYQSWLAK